MVMLSRRIQDTMRRETVSFLLIKYLFFKVFPETSSGQAVNSPSQLRCAGSVHAAGIKGYQINVLQNHLFCIIVLINRYEETYIHSYLFNYLFACTSIKGDSGGIYPCKRLHFQYSYR